MSLPSPGPERSPSNLSFPTPAWVACKLFGTRFVQQLTSRIGKGGAKIKEIQEASGARLNASEAMLPGSTEVGSPVKGIG
jgi:heterogeneous nuclear rnp K-like protein 2